MYKKWHGQWKNDLILTIIIVPFYHTHEYQLLHSKMQQTLYYKHEPSVNNFYINYLGYGNFFH